MRSRILLDIYQDNSAPFTCNFVPYKNEAMATTITTNIRIQATPQQVWNVLTDFSGYESWNPFIRSLKGEVAAGSDIEVHIVPPGQKGMTFRPRVQAFDREQRLEWLGHLLFPGLFDGKHRFELIDHGDGSTTLVHSETFRGILVPFLKKMLSGPTTEGFRQMNEAVKQRSEMR